MVDSLRPNDTYMRQLAIYVFDLMAHGLFGTKPLSEQVKC